MLTNRPPFLILLAYLHKITLDEVKQLDITISFKSPLMAFFYMLFSKTQRLKPAHQKSYQLIKFHFFHKRDKYFRLI